MNNHQSYYYRLVHTTQCNVKKKLIFTEQLMLNVNSRQAHIGDDLFSDSQ